MLLIIALDKQWCYDNHNFQFLCFPSLTLSCEFSHQYLIALLAPFNQLVFVTGFLIHISCSHYASCYYETTYLINHHNISI